MAGTFIFWYVIMPPTVIHGFMFIMKALDRGFKEALKERFFKGCLIIVAVGVVAELLNNFLFLTITMGYIYLFATVAVIYVAYNLSSYFSNGFKMSEKW